jgi:hypothetical protein
MSLTSLINTSIPIEPKAQPECASFCITNVQMPLNNTATISINLFDADLNLIRFSTVILESTDYCSWTDDSSLISLIRTKLGMSAPL